MTNEEKIAHAMSYLGNEVNCLRHKTHATIINFDMVSNDGCVRMIGIVPNDTFRYPIEIYNPSIGWAEMNPTLSVEEEMIIKNNILIAEYMNYPKDGIFYTINTFNITTYNQRKYHREQLCFHLSWDWLMPVLDKIMETTDEQVKAFEGLNLFEYGLGTDIKTIYTEIINYINWYNENKDNQ